MPCGAEVSQFDKDNRWVRLTTELTGATDAARWVMEGAGRGSVRLNDWLGRGYPRGPERSLSISSRYFG